MRTITPSTLQSYETHLQSEEKSPNTIAKYLRAFTVWLAARENPDITKETVICYKHHLEQTYRPVSANSMLVAINRFFRYMGWDDCIVKTLKTQPSHIYAQEKELTRADYQKLINTARSEGRDRLALVIETIGSIGIRVSKLASLTFEAVKDGTVTVSCKGKYCEICLVHKLRQKLLGYCKKQRIKSGSIFITRNGNPLDRSNIWAEMKKLAERAGVDLKKGRCCWWAGSFIVHSSRMKFNSVWNTSKMSAVLHREWDLSSVVRLLFLLIIRSVKSH